MKKRVILILCISMAIMLVLTACESECVEAGGRSICAGPNMELIQGTSGVWEVPGKYQFECTGVYFDDVNFDEVEPLRSPTGGVVFTPKGRFFIEYKVTNLGYELTEDDRKEWTINLSSYYSILRINSGDDVNIRPYPWEDDDYKYDEVLLSNWEMPAVEIGETKDEFYDEFVVDKPIDFDNDVVVFTVFFNDGEDTYNGVFEMKFKSLKEYMES